MYTELICTGSLHRSDIYTYKTDARVNHACWRSMLHM